MKEIDLAALDVPQLEALIARAIAERELRAPAIADEPPNPAMALQDPRWFTVADVLSGNAVLLLRHPGAGWLGFAFPPAERDRLRALWDAQAAAQLAAPATSLAN